MLGIFRVSEQMLTNRCCRPPERRWYPQAYPIPLAFTITNIIERGKSSRLHTRSRVHGLDNKLMLKQFKRSEQHKFPFSAAAVFSLKPMLLVKLYDAICQAPVSVFWPQRGVEAHWFAFSAAHPPWPPRLEVPCSWIEAAFGPSTKCFLHREVTLWRAMMYITD